MDINMPLMDGIEATEAVEIGVFFLQKVDSSPLCSAQFKYVNTLFQVD